jgi:uncharacterized protein (DUF736 family)
MATIGTFTQTQDGGYTGAINTLSLNVKSAQFRRNESENPNAPDYRIFAGATELGAAWKKTSAENREYLSVKLDDPSFPEEIKAILVEGDGVQNLVWSRERKVRKARRPRKAQA